jgi:aminoglycoside phosphotransferase (APT) family kinase protein
MAREWDADVAFSTEDAARLIERQFPGLAPAQLEPFGVGWDNAAFVVNGQYLFRFPRRKVAAGLIEREVRILPRLAPHLPLPIPAPTFFGRPDAGYPYPFSGYPMIPGQTACRCDWTEPDRARIAAPLARFLAALHRIPLNEETRTWAPGDEIERTHLMKRAVVLRERLRAVVPALAGIDVDALGETVDRLSGSPPHAGLPCWVHGDLYARHLLVDDQRRLCGVIDWGDVHLGDPALDLSIAFSFLPADARLAFRAAYGPIDAATWDRARFRALHYGVMLLSYGADVDDTAIHAVGEYSLRTALL